MKIYLMTDMEGVAGVVSFGEWTGPGKPYYPVARELLTGEVNAVVQGLFMGGAEEVVVCDAHGPGGVNVQDLFPRADYMRGWADQTWPLNLDPSYDAVAWVGQHAKACTPFGHLCHTQSLEYIDESVNGVSIGEFGELALCAAELGARAVFASGDEAFTREAQALVPGIETVAVKRGLRSGTGEDLDVEAYTRYVGSAIHTNPVQARSILLEAARNAIKRALADSSYGHIPPLTPPFSRTVIFRPGPNRPAKTIMRVAHPTSFIGVMNEWAEATPLEQE